MASPSESSLPGGAASPTPVVPYPLYEPVVMVPMERRPRPRKPYTATKAREMWTTEEHERMLEGLRLFQRDWARVTSHVGTRSAAQVRSHAQKYFDKVARDKTDDYVPRARPKRKAAQPYPRKAAAPSVAQQPSPNMQRLPYYGPVMQPVPYPVMVDTLPVEYALHPQTRFPYTQCVPPDVHPHPHAFAQVAYVQSPHFPSSSPMHPNAALRTHPAVQPRLSPGSYFAALSPVTPATHPALSPMQVAGSHIPKHSHPGGPSPDCAKCNALKRYGNVFHELGGALQRPQYHSQLQPRSESALNTHGQRMLPAMSPMLSTAPCTPGAPAPRPSPPIAAVHRMAASYDAARSPHAMPAVQYFATAPPPEMRNSKVSIETSTADLHSPKLSEKAVPSREYVHLAMSMPQNESHDVEENSSTPQLKTPELGAQHPEHTVQLRARRAKLLKARKARTSSNPSTPIARGPGMHTKLDNHTKRVAAACESARGHRAPAAGAAAANRDGSHPILDKNAQVVGEKRVNIVDENKHHISSSTIALSSEDNRFSQRSGRASAVPGSASESGNGKHSLNCSTKRKFPEDITQSRSHEGVGHRSLPNMKGIASEQSSSEIEVPEVFGRDESQNATSGRLSPSKRAKKASSTTTYSADGPTSVVNNEDNTQKSFASATVKSHLRKEQQMSQEIFEAVHSLQILKRQTP